MAHFSGSKLSSCIPPTALYTPRLHSLFSLAGAWVRISSTAVIVSAVFPLRAVPLHYRDLFITFQSILYECSLPPSLPPSLLPPDLHPLPLLVFYSLNSFFFTSSFLPSFIFPPLPLSPPSLPLFPPLLLLPSPQLSPPCPPSSAHPNTATSSPSLPNPTSASPPSA